MRFAFWTSRPLRPRRSSRLLLSNGSGRAPRVQQHTRNQQPVDLVRAFEDAVDSRIAIRTFLLRSPGEIRSLRGSELLHRRRNRALPSHRPSDRALNGIFLNRLQRGPGSALNKPDRSPSHRFRRIDAYRHLSQLVLNGAKIAIVEPNALRSFAYLMLSSRTRLAPPTASVPSFNRPIFRMLKAMMWPRPILPEHWRQAPEHSQNRPPLSSCP